MTRTHIIKNKVGGRRKSRSSKENRYKNKKQRLKEW